MSDSETETTGRDLTTEHVLEAIHRADTPFLSTGQVMDHLEIAGSKPTVLDRLKTLREQGRIASHTVASNTYVWYIPDPEQSTFHHYQDGEPPEEPPRDPTADGALEGAKAIATREVVDDLESRINTAVQEAVEDFEQELVREQSEHVSKTWEEKAREEVQKASNLVGKASAILVIGVVVFVAIQTVAPDILTTSLPIVGDLSGAINGFAGLALLVILWGGLYIVVVWAFARSGAAEWVEQSAIGSWYDRLASNTEE